MGDQPHQLSEVRIGDDAAAWDRAGFVLDDDGVTIDACRLDLAGAEGQRGILSIAIDGVDGTLDPVGNNPPRGIEIHLPARRPYEPAPPRHHNHVTAIDHLVVTTPDCERTTASLQAAGIEARRVRTFESDGEQRRQAFFWLGRVILELVGSDTERGDGPARIWGLALTSSDLDATVALLGERCSAPRPAVQKGRRIATLRTRDLDISTAVAFMSPHQAVR